MPPPPLFFGQKLEKNITDLIYMACDLIYTPADLIYISADLIYALAGGTFFSKKKYIKGFYIIVTISEDALVRHKSIAFGGILPSDVAPLHCFR